MYPLLLQVPTKEFLWGGNKLKQEFGLQSDTQTIAEGWMLSCREDAPCIVGNGELCGKTLPEVLALWGPRAIEKSAERVSEFPLLIKLIDAKKNLSVQVHPNDEYAQKHGIGFGKTEMWYVLDCEDGASLIYGLNQAVSKEEFLKHIRNQTLEEVCNTVSVHPGDVFFIPAGMLHAIGKGILIAEVQQNSDTTYRVWDYGRVDANGNPRPLHIEQATEVVDRTAAVLPSAQTANIQTAVWGSVRELTKCAYFTVKEIQLCGEMTLDKKESFVSLIVLDGELCVMWQRGTLKVSKGGSLFIPAGVAVQLSGRAELLYTSLS